MKFALFGQYYQTETQEIVTTVITFFKEKKIPLIIEKTFYDSISFFLKEDYPTYVSHQDLDNDITALLSIGGDGTILRAVTYVRDKNIPIVGINAGRLGFLATVQTEEINFLLEKIITKKYTISKRTLLGLTNNPTTTKLSDFNFALNEIAVSRKDTTSMISIKTYLNKEYLTTYWADGLIISTPTGSTGYSLSCGGPILTPGVNSLVITPIAPHNLTARPLVITDDTEIKLEVSGRAKEYLTSLDSRTVFIDKDTTLYVKKAPFTISLIEFKEVGFLETIRKKLLWGEDKRN